MLGGPKVSEGTSVRQFITYGLLLIVCLVLIFLLGGRGMRFFLVPSASMEPTLVPPEYLITFDQEEYTRGDIVVVEDPMAPGSYLVKRIVGLEGDSLSIKGGALHINKSYASEPYAAAPIQYMMDEYRVDAGEVFVLGDNRNASVDSHNWQADVVLPGDDGQMRRPAVNPQGIPVELIVGKVRYVYLPLKRARIVHSYPLTNVEGE